MARKNPNLKRANQETEFTPDQVQELKKCMEDPIYFIKKYVKIQHPTKGTVPFRLFDYQEDMIRAYQKHQYTIVLSARQTGKCCLGTTDISIITKPSIIKKIILWLVDRKLYNEIFKNI